MSNIVGYAQVSRQDQNPAAQEAELAEAGAVKVFVDHGESSRVKNRPQWLACLNYLRAGDTLMVCRLDRIAGSEKMAIETINDLADRGVNVKSLTEPDIVTTTPMGWARPASWRCSRSGALTRPGRTPAEVWPMPARRAGVVAGRR